jgi:inorganic pyrophosphatase
MRDDKGEDDKIVAVCIDDPAYAHYTSIDELPPHIMLELDRFFRDYKLLEGKETEVDQPIGRDRALEVVRDAIRNYRHP